MSPLGLQAEEIAEKLCRSVETSLVGRKQGSFTRVSTIVKVGEESSVIVGARGGRLLQALNKGTVGPLWSPGHLYALCGCILRPEWGSWTLRLLVRAVCEPFPLLPFSSCRQRWRTL